MKSLFLPLTLVGQVACGDPDSLHTFDRNQMPIAADRRRLEFAWRWTMKPNWGSFPCCRLSSTKKQQVLLVMSDNAITTDNALSSFRSSRFAGRIVAQFLALVTGILISYNVPS